MPVPQEMSGLERDQKVKRNPPLPGRRELHLQRASEFAEAQDERFCLAK